MKRSVLGVTALIMAILLTAAHPSDNGRIDEALLHRYAKSIFDSAEMSMGDMQFHGPQPSVLPGELTHAEQYILFGVRTSSMPDSGPMQPWSQLIYSFVQRYHATHGSVPSVLTEELVRNEFTAHHGDVAPSQLEPHVQALRSPITGEWPRLDATAFSPGDCMIRPLTQMEIDHIAAKNNYYKMIFKQRRGVNPSSGVIETLELKTPPFYVRIYGETKPLVQMIQYSIDYE